MPPRGEQPAFSDIIRPPETAEEEWVETARLAASILDLRGPHDRHRTAQTDKVGITESPTFEENTWKDYATGDEFILRRYWNRATAESQNWHAIYYLRVYKEEAGPFDIAKPDIIYAFIPARSMADECALRISDDEKFSSLEDWCKEEDEDPDNHFGYLYDYLCTSMSSPELSLGALKSRRTGELLDVNKRFAEIVLGEAVVASAVHIELLRNKGSFDTMEQSMNVAQAVSTGVLEIGNEDAPEGERLGVDAIYSIDDAGPGNWRLNQQALASAVAEQLMTWNDKVPSSEDPKRAQ